MSQRFAAEPMRSALAELKLYTAEVASESPSWDRILTVREHEGALDPARPVVIGDRGTGKSFWTGVLLDSEKRSQLSKIYRRLQLENIDVALGYGGAEFTADHPTRSELIHLLSNGFASEPIWRAVILSLLPPEIRPESMEGPWSGRVRWIIESPSLRQDVFRAADRYFLDRKKRFLIAFDALDTMSSRWEEITALVRGLLELSLFLRSSRAIRTKLFLRPDMADEPSLWAVGDSSKLRYDEVTLTWTRRDLHALLIQYLANNIDTRNEVSQFIQAEFGTRLSFDGERYQLPDGLMTDEDQQKLFFAAIAGDFMGKSRTKGLTYTWAPNHLANAKGYAAPRSFLLAISVAAERSKSPDTALDVQGLQEGVRHASQIRMQELREDYRWIDAVFRPLRDSLVPMEKDELIKRWRDEDVVSAITREMEQDNSGRYLPPPRVGLSDSAASHKALADTLEHLGILETTGNGRINMPDLFRLAAGVKRKGGVKLRP